MCISSQYFVIISLFYFLLYFVLFFFIVCFFFIIFYYCFVFFFFSSRRRHTRCGRDWSSDVCSSDLSVFFTSKSGHKLNGWMLKPKDIHPKATILFFHGNSGDLVRTHWSMTLLLQEGFQVFAIDYSGYGLSEGKAKRKHLLNDGNAAVDYLISREDVKGKKVIIYGQSLGGHLASVVATNNQDKIDALVIEGAFSSHKDIGKEFAGFLGKWLVKEMYSAKASLPGFTKPFLVIHSTEDEIIPFYMGKDLYNVANEPKTFYEIDGCHICGSRLYAEEIANKIFDLVKN